MSSKTLIVNHKYLYDILNEISENINFEVINGLDKDIDHKHFKNYIFLSTKKEKSENSHLIITEFPIKIKKLIEIININFLRKNYNLQSNIKVGEYELDLKDGVMGKAVEQRKCIRVGDVRKDVREIGDNNPGAVNAWKSAGAYVGLIVMFLEFLKAILPIAIAIRFFDLNGYNLVFISLMPIFGHSFSPFLKFRGGKALAVTAAMWLALFQFEAAIVIFGLLAISCSV